MTNRGSVTWPNRITRPSVCMNWFTSGFGCATIITRRPGWNPGAECMESPVEDAPFITSAFTRSKLKSSITGFFFALDFLFAFPVSSISNVRPVTSPTVKPASRICCMT